MRTTIVQSKTNAIPFTASFTVLVRKSILHSSSAFSIHPNCLLPLNLGYLILPAAQKLLHVLLSATPHIQHASRIVRCLGVSLSKRQVVFCQNLENRQKYENIISIIFLQDLLTRL